MDDYVHAWMARIRWADLRRTADEAALGRAFEHEPLSDGATPQPDSKESAGGKPASRRARSHGPAVAAVLLAWSMSASPAWSHGGHPHGLGAAARAVPATPAATIELEARSVRFDFDPPRPGSYRLPVVKPEALSILKNLGWIVPLPIGPHTVLPPSPGVCFQ